MDVSAFTADVGKPIIVAVVTLGLGWFVGNRIGIHWDAVRKQRELDLRAVDDFYHLYGEFFAVWKLWNANKRFHEQSHPPSDCQWRLMERAAAAEGGIEALIVKMTCQRALQPEDTAIMARFREAFQSLRESIRANEELAWRGTTEEYEAFKALSAWFAAQLSSAKQTHEPSVLEASKALAGATSHAYKRRWWLGPVPLPKGGGELIPPQPSAGGDRRNRAVFSRAGPR